MVLKLESITVGPLPKTYSITVLSDPVHGGPMLTVVVPYDPPDSITKGEMDATVKAAAKVVLQDALALL